LQRRLLKQLVQNYERIGVAAELWKGKGGVVVGRAGVEEKKR
jgi:hypothetical protein